MNNYGVVMDVIPDPTPMLAYLSGRASDRKLRLYAVGCCRRLWDLFTDRRAWKAIEFAERYADGCLVVQHESRLDSHCVLHRLVGSSQTAQSSRSG